MTFIWPVMLVFLLAVPALVAAYVALQRRRRVLLASYANLGLVQQTAGRRNAGNRRHIPAVLFLAALTILVVATARPQAKVNLPTLTGKIILAFDVSGSMSADDMKPSRLEAAKAAARAFVERQPATVQIGVVTFSESGLALQIPTSDQASVLAAISRLKVQSGTSVGQGIQAALNALASGTDVGGDRNGEPSSLSDPASPTPSPTPVPPGSYTSAAIVLITDGENNVRPDPVEAAQAAADRGVRIYTVGVGSTAGATLHLNGFTVRSRLDEATLQKISELTGGTYYNAETESDLHAIYDNLSPKLELKLQNTEVTAIFAGAGIFLLLLGGSLSLLWLGRVP